MTRVAVNGKSSPGRCAADEQGDPGGNGAVTSVEMEEGGVEGSRGAEITTPAEREQLLMFVTGSRRPPVGGFSQLQGFNGGIHRFTLSASAEPKDSLPRAHACICTIDVPAYSSYRTLRRALHTALSLGSVGFDDAAVHAADGNSDDEEAAG